MTSETPTIHREELQLKAHDGYPLCATLYHAPAPRARLLIGGATGVPQGFYRRFAEYAAQRGYTTLSLDYRGIGLSKPAQLRGFAMQYLNWATHDLAAALDHLHGDDLPTYMVGHSFGGHAFGLLPGHERVSGFYTFGTGAGWHGWMPPLERVRVQLMWNLIGPLIVWHKGYLAWSKLGMGEDLPLGVYQQWKRWCRYPRYFFDDPEQSHLAACFDSVRTPIVAANTQDDLWAPPASRDAFMAAYSAAPYQARTIDSQAEGLGAVGHMGYFRSSAAPLWDEALNWFAQLQTNRRAA